MLRSFRRAHAVSSAREAMVLTDLTALAAAYAAGTLFLLLGYVLAGQVWVERHSIQLTGPGRARRVSGFWGEFFLFTACAAVVGVVRAFTSVGILRDVIAPYPGYAAGVFAAVIVLVLLYSASVVDGARRDGEDGAYRGKLRNAYLAYSVYSAILFAGGLCVLALLGVEFARDQIGFARQADVVSSTVEAALNAARGGADQLAAATQSLTYLEDAMGEIAMAESALQDQMNPVFVFAALVFTVNILIVLSPIRSAFMQGAVDLTHILTAIAIGAVLIAAFVSYFASYSLIIEHTIAQMGAARPPASLGAWELSRRYNEMIVALNGQRNILGFAQTVGGQGSGLALFAGGVQFTLERIPARHGGA
jgi:hypothetical protein